ncbi:MAG: chemotaxis protein CheB [Gemmatimonadales bacterium]
MTGTADRRAEGAPFTKPVIGIATSAGGLSALSRVLSALPTTLDAAIVVVQHLDPARPSHLADILGRREAA